MNAQQRRVRDRLQEAHKLATEAAAEIARRDAEIEALHYRIARLEEDAKRLTAERDERAAELRRQRVKAERLQGEVSGLKKTQRALDKALTDTKERLTDARASTEAWRRTAERYEVDAKQTEKYRRRLQDKARAAREAPANRIAAGFVKEGI